MIISKGKVKSPSPELLKIFDEIEKLEEGDSLTFEEAMRVPLHSEMKAMEIAINILGYLTVCDYHGMRVTVEGNKVHVEFEG